MNAASVSKLLPLRTVLARGHLRLVVMAVLLAAGTMTGSGLLLLRGYTAKNLDLSASTLRYAIEPAVYFGDMQALREAVEPVAGAGDLARVEVLDPQRKIILDWRASGDDHQSIAAQLGRLLAPSPVELTVYNGAGEVLSTVRVTASVGRLLNYALSGLIIALCAIGLTVLATRILTRRLEEDVVAPIEHVAQVADAVRRHREFGLRAGPSRIAEVNQFSNDFNALLVELEGWHEGFLTENRTLAHLSEHDPLTGLGNRLLFERELQLSLDRAASGQLPFTLLFIDLNRFKQINDVYGHLAGDAILAEFGHRLRSTLRARDQAFRYGGDEFVVLLDPLVRDARTTAVIERIGEIVTDPVVLPDGTALALAISIGTASYPSDASSAEGLLQHADEKMYASKRKQHDAAQN